MWTFEASGVYEWYSSIAEKGTSVRARFNKKLSEKKGSRLNTSYPSLDDFL